ncbi:MAG: hypothetical protein ABEI11_00650 [Haloarculaceae archaeon]
MSGSDPKPKNPLEPYYPSEVPDIPGNGRTWFAVLLSALLLLGAAYGLLSLLFSL